MIDSFTVWVDADSCPTLVRSFILKYALKKNVPVYFVANRHIPGPTNNSLFKMIICGKEKNAADAFIDNNVTINDIVVTRDILFAEKLVNKDISVMNDRGILFSKDTIKERLSERNFSFQLSQIGLTGDKRSSYGKKEFTAFSACFDREMQKRLAKRIQK